MTDRYEQFKQYCVENHIVGTDNGLLNLLFEGFEAKIEREERETAIKNIISYSFYDKPYWKLSQTDRVDCTYNNLNGRGYLK